MHSNVFSYSLLYFLSSCNTLCNGLLHAPKIADDALRESVDLQLKTTLQRIGHELSESGYDKAHTCARPSCLMIMLAIAVVALSFLAIFPVGI